MSAQAKAVAPAATGERLPAAVAERADRVRSELGALYPFASHFLRGPRGWLHAVDEGPRQAPAVVFLHGNPSWSFLWRDAVRALSGRYRVIALDHLGMGLSGPLPTVRYTLTERVEDVRAALSQLGVEHFALVGHDWGGAISLGLVRREPGRVQALALGNTAGFLGLRLPLSIRACRWPLLGPRLLEDWNLFLKVAVRRCTARPLSPEVARAYLAPHRTPIERRSIRAFVEDIPFAPSDRSYEEVAAIERFLPTLAQGEGMPPVLLLWGERDFCFHGGFRRAFEQRLPRAESIPLPNAGHWWTEDAAKVATQHLADFFSRALG